ncbi:aminopeptidase [Ideonella sp.]|uniref:aminopeptidase n=1 Tax=Ideonella sp. TaxID=1929293 RepID=UPI002B47FCAD|nr:aminopeptidase [Ideonella sp.]HJV68302.1 aminopeptidase [Ideonella sp.]
MRLRGWLVASAVGIVGLLALAVGTVCVTSGCSSLGYLAQSAAGHLHIVNSARPVDDWIADPATSEALRTRLELAKRMREFAVTALKLPDNDSYRRFTDLKRPAAVWNVAAAPELSLRLETWCYPVVGCVGYRGYYAQADADAEAAALRARGLETTVYPVPAYSTLGKMEWLGGDPLLSTFIQWPESELARLIFHELAHQVAYAPGDSMFNESFATAVERLGGERWMAAEGSPGGRTLAAAIEQRRRDFRGITQDARRALDALYHSAASDEAKRAGKAEIMARLRAGHAALKAGPWGGFAGYDAFFANANNASLGMQAVYLDWVPAFSALFEREGSDFERFYAEVRRLAGLPRAERDATLRGLTPPAPDHPTN